MDLISPRFKGNEYLKKVASNAVVLERGNIGNSVHLVQQALLDLGYNLPSGSDGVFGSDTEKAIKVFQKNIPKAVPKIDGIVNEATISALDKLLPTYEYCVRLNLFFIHRPQVSLNILMDCTKEVYAQYGIRIDKVSEKDLVLNKVQKSRFFTISTACDWEYNKGEAFQLLSLVISYPSSEISTVFIRKAKTYSGCGGHITGHPACIVDANPNKWTPAHEIGHVLLTESFSPVHSGNTKNIMHSTQTYYPLTPILSNKQLIQIRQHPCCTKIR